MCVFCKIVNGEIPCYKVYETKDVLCFLDLSQATKGHTLVVPKKHIENIYDLDEETGKEVMAACVHVANRLKTGLGSSSVNVLNNSGSLAGQSVMHLHFHLLPRYSEDNLKISFTDNKPTPEQMKELCAIISDNKKND